MKTNQGELQKKVLELIKIVNGKEYNPAYRQDVVCSLMFSALQAIDRTPQLMCFGAKCDTSTLEGKMEYFLTEYVKLKKIKKEIEYLKNK